MCGAPSSCGVAGASSPPGWQGVGFRLGTARKKRAELKSSFGQPVEDQEHDAGSDDPRQHQRVFASLPLDGGHQSVQQGKPTLQRLCFSADPIKHPSLLAHGDGHGLRLVDDFVCARERTVYGAPFPQECIVSIGIRSTAHRRSSCQKCVPRARPCGGRGGVDANTCSFELALQIGEDVAVSGQGVRRIARTDALVHVRVHVSQAHQQLLDLRGLGLCHLNGGGVVGAGLGAGETRERGELGVHFAFELPGLSARPRRPSFASVPFRHVHVLPISSPSLSTSAKKAHLASQVVPSAQTRRIRHRHGTMQDVSNRSGSKPDGFGFETETDRGTDRVRNRVPWDEKEGKPVSQKERDRIQFIHEKLAK